MSCPERGVGRTVPPFVLLVRDAVAALRAGSGFARRGWLVVGVWAVALWVVALWWG